MSDEPLSLCWIELTKDARMVAYLACKARSGKVKLKELKQSNRIRNAILDDCDINEGTGRVDWKSGLIKFDGNDDFEQFARMVRRHLEDEGVEFDLGTGAEELILAVESKEEELRALKKAADEPAK